MTFWFYRSIYLIQCIFKIAVVNPRMWSKFSWKNNGNMLVLAKIALFLFNGKNSSKSLAPLDNLLSSTTF